MSFLVYQRSDPRYVEWNHLRTQQIRLRNLIQVIGVNLEVADHEMIYYTLHSTQEADAFYVSETLKNGSVVNWKELEPGRFSNCVPLSAEGFVIRVWSICDERNPITSWGVYFRGLHYLGSKGEWNIQGFTINALVFRMPYGFFTARCCLLKTPNESGIYMSHFIIKQPEAVRNSYTVKGLAALHDVQRSVLEEVELCRKLRRRISDHGYSANLDGGGNATKDRDAHGMVNGPANFANLLSGRALVRFQEGELKLQRKEQIESLRLLVGLLKNEKARFEGRVLRLKQKAKNSDDSVTDLMANIYSLGRERDRLREVKALIQEKMRRLGECRSTLNLRKKQLISELMVIYPLQLVEGSKRYSIAEVQLPNAEDYGSETGGQVSVALGYTAHLVAMLTFFLGIPLRYPILHFGSRSRIVDHITMQIPNKEREFPLYFRGREDVYSKYAVYLLNKNIAQLRWYCGLSTPDLRATLPNLYSVLTSRLIIPGWPPSPSESCELAEELTEETHHHIFRNDLSVSLDGGLDQISSAPKLSHEMRMQSWLSASYTELDAAGSNSVPAGELQHGRAQNRFLNYWKKKTYSESEDIDPVWLTNSLNLELDLGSGRFSNIPSSPMRLPVISTFESNNTHQNRKRRFGRVEARNAQAGVEAAEDTRTSNFLYVPGTSHLFTPNRSMNDVEQRIIANERRKSVCDSTRIGVNRKSPTPFETAQVDNTIPLDAPFVDNYPTTDDERLDTSLVDVVRRLSQAAPVPKYNFVKNLGDFDTAVYPSADGQSYLKIMHEFDGVPKDDEEEFFSICELNKPCDISEATENNSSKTKSQQERRLASVISKPKKSNEALSCASDETENTCSKDEQLVSHSPPVEGYHQSSHNYTDRADMVPDSKSSLNMTSEFQRDMATSGVPEKDYGNGDRKSEVTFSITGVEDDSIWLRTEALLNSSTSFNRVKRRTSESN